jgi:pilus assembly protein Flp/PilA
MEMRKLLKSFVRDERGVSALEYAILAGIVVVAVVAVGAIMTPAFTNIFGNLFTKVQNAAGK